MSQPQLYSLTLQLPDFEWSHLIGAFNHMGTELAQVFNTVGKAAPRNNSIQRGRNAIYKIQNCCCIFSDIHKHENRLNMQRSLTSEHQSHSDLAVLSRPSISLMYRFCPGSHRQLLTADWPNYVCGLSHIMNGFSKLPTKGNFDWTQECPKVSGSTFQAFHPKVSKERRRTNHGSMSLSSKTLLSTQTMSSAPTKTIFQKALCNGQQLENKKVKLQTQGSVFTFQKDLLQSFGPAS